MIGGLDFEVFDAQAIGSRLGGNGSYFWFTESLDNAGFYANGAIHEGRLQVEIADHADAQDFPGLSARAIADEIFITRHQAGEPVPNAYMISGMQDGSHRAVVIAVCAPP